MVAGQRRLFDSAWVKILATVVWMLVACSNESPRRPPSAAPPTTKPTTVTADDARAVGMRLQAVAKPCDIAKVAALFDRQGFIELVEQRGRSTDAAEQLRQIEQLISTASNKFCAWVERADDVRLLHVHVVDGEPRALLRRVTAVGFGYYDVRVARGVRSEEPRILDIYAHNDATWISDEIADALAMPGSDQSSIALTLLRINSLDKDGKPAEALAALDALPEPTLGTRSIQKLRVAISYRLSPEAHAAALREHARRFPDDKPSAIDAMNRAYLRGDLDEALAQVDVLDRAIGTDGFLDAIRASLLVQRNRAGDLDAAAKLAERAVEAARDLQLPHNTLLMVALTRRDWATAVSVLTLLETWFALQLSDDDFRTVPGGEDFLATPEYQRYRKPHP